MLWADKILEKAEAIYKDKIANGKPIIIRDEKTASGRVHVGSLRGVAIHGMLSEVLTEKNIANKYYFEINDFDPMDGLPVYLDQEKFKPFMGKPLCDVPSPDGIAKNYAEYFGQEFVGVIESLGFKPETYRSSELYKSGKFNETIKLTLENAPAIREIYKRISGSVKAGDWLPLNVVCENCGKVGTTKAISFDGTLVGYVCGKYADWAEGCGHEGKVSPYDGHAKLPWKVEWAAKFKIFDVDIEGAGKDHSTKGGSRDIAEAISREIFKHEPPLNVPYEFFQVGGKKMSSSKGKGSSSKEIADLLPPHILRLLMLQKEPMRVIEFMPDGDTIPILYDTYDTYAEKYFTHVDDDWARLFRFVHFPGERNHLKKRALPRFSQVAYLVQMPHVDIEKEIEKLENIILTDDDKEELELRKKYAKIWLDTCAPEDYKFEIQEKMPERVKEFTSEQKAALAKVLEFVKSRDILEGQDLHTNLHEIRKASGLEAKQFFAPLYISFLNKDNGPKAGWFFSVLDKKFIEKRLEDVTK
jgi:lysyl-tRNA synthetase class 1